MEREQFEQLVRAAVEALPQEFQERLSNVEFHVEDRPGPEHLRGAGIRGGILLGLYTGVPVTRRGQGYNMALPDRILIFKEPIESLCRDDDAVARRVAQVVRHEVAHYFGISDTRLRDIGAY